MTQSKPIKKKKKIKTIKSKKNDKKEEECPPVDKKTVAENNLRQLIQRAHEIHKEHKRHKGILKHTTNELQKNQGINNSSTITFDSRITESDIQKKSGKYAESSTTVCTKKSEKRSEKLPQNEGKALKHSSICLPKVPQNVNARISQTVKPKSSAISADKDNKESINRKKIIIHPTESITKKNVTSPKELTCEPVTKTKQQQKKEKVYHVGRTPFVSLEVLDKMKCHESDVCLNTKKGILRHKSQTEASGAVKKDRKQRKKEDSQKTTEKKVKLKEMKSSLNCYRADSELMAIPKVSEKINLKPNSASSNVKSISSIFDSTVSSNVGAGDLFDSYPTVSHSYFSSDSDVSKINIKFMQVLEALTQRSMKIKINNNDTQSTDSIQKPVSEEIVQSVKKDMSQINSFKLKDKESKTCEENLQKVHEMPSAPKKVNAPDIKELWINGNSSRDERSDTSLDYILKERIKNKPEPAASENGLKMDEHDKSTREKRIIPDHSELVPKALTEQPAIRTCQSSLKKYIPKNEESDARSSDYKSLGTWSIMKRLEKAFHTLGLNMDDVEDSDDSAKKKRRVKMRRSYGKEKCISKKEVPRKDIEKEPISKKKKKNLAIANDVEYIERNGSGDKNLDYKAVRPVKKVEDLLKVTKKVENRRNKEAYYASIRYPKHMLEYSNDSFFDDFESKSIKRSRMIKGVDNGCIKQRIKMRGDVEQEKGKRAKKHRINEYGVNCRSDIHKSECSISMTCSLNSLSGEPIIKYPKRKKISHSLGVRSSRSHGDLSRMIRNENDDSSSLRYSSRNGKALTGFPKTKIYKMEEESNELEIRLIRDKHKQIMSEIKSSLDEIKKQNTLYKKLHHQTKRFSKDCYFKKRLIAEYLKDIENKSENNNYKRALSSDTYYSRNILIEDEFSDYNTRKKVHRKSPSRRNRPIVEVTETSTDEVTNEVKEASSIVISEKSLQSVTSLADSTKKEEKTLCLEWKKKGESELDIGEAPSYFVQLLKKLNRIILTEKNQLKELVVKASGTSNNSSFYDIKSISSNSSGSERPKHRKKIISEHNRVNSVASKSGLSTASGGRNPKHGSKLKDKESTKGIKMKSEKLKKDLSRRKLMSTVQGDPGGGSFDTLSDREQEIVLSESFPIQSDADEPSYTQLENHVEELRYRKGDPSFRSFGSYDSYSLQECRRMTPEEERALRRQKELERILRANERHMKISSMFKRGNHALDYEPHHKRIDSGYKHSQQSIIIDHNRREDNEESETVLGHASRHSGFVPSRKAPHEYLKGDRRSESHYKTNRRSHDSSTWRKSGIRHYMEEFPVSYFELPVNTRLKDAHCQTDTIEDFDDMDDIYLLEESASNNSQNRYHKN